MNEAARRRPAVDKHVASQRVGFGRPPGGEMDQSDIGRPKGSMNEAARWRMAIGEHLRLGFGRPPGDEMDRSNIGRPKGPMNEAAWRRKAFGKPLRSKAGLIWAAAERRD